MTTLYALLGNRIDVELHDCFIEVVDADSMTLQILIPLGKRYPTAFAIAPAQQRLYVVGPSHKEVLAVRPDQS